MSIKIMAAIWDGSKHTGSKLLLMLALADFANDDGVCWPGMSTLAKKIRTTRRNTVYMIKELLESGELSREARASERGTNLYRIHLDQLVKSASPSEVVKPISLVNASSLGVVKPTSLGVVKPTSHDPSIKPSIKPSAIKAKKKETCPKEWTERLYALSHTDAATATIETRNNISTCGKALIAGHATLDMLDTFEKNWYAHDWRGQKDQAPTIKQIRDEWGKYSKPIMTGNGSNANAATQRHIDAPLPQSALEAGDRINAQRHGTTVEYERAQRLQATSGASHA